MFLVRLIAGLFWLVAIILLGIDAILSVQADKLTMTPVGTWWYRIDPASLNIVQAFFERYLTPALWDPGIVWLLHTPAWAVAAALALIVSAILPRKKTKPRLIKE